VRNWFQSLVSNATCTATPWRACCVRCARWCLRLSSTERPSSAAVEWNHPSTSWRRCSTSRATEEEGEEEREAEEEEEEEEEAKEEEEEEEEELGRRAWTLQLIQGGSLTRLTRLTRWGCIS
jgi:hypothetical protein